MSWVTVGGENRDLVSKRFETYGRIDYESLSTANTEIGVEENYVLRHLW